MTYLAALDLLLKYGPIALQQGLKLAQIIKEGKGASEVTPEDIAELVAYGNQKGADYFVKVSPAPAA
jgi:hypothetical protein